MPPAGQNGTCFYIKIKIIYINFLSGCLPLLVQSQRSLAGRSLIIWLAAGQPFIFLFISGVLNWHSLSEVRHQRPPENELSWLGRCESCVPCFTSKIDFFRVVEWDTSGLCGLKQTYNIYHVETHRWRHVYSKKHVSSQFRNVFFQLCVSGVWSWSLKFAMLVVPKGKPEFPMSLEFIEYLQLMSWQ